MACVGGDWDVCAGVSGTVEGGVCGVKRRRRWGGGVASFLISSWLFRVVFRSFYLVSYLVHVAPSSPVAVVAVEPPNEIPHCCPFVGRWREDRKRSGKGRARLQKAALVRHSDRVPRARCVRWFARPRRRESCSFSTNRQWRGKEWIAEKPDVYRLVFFAVAAASFSRATRTIPATDTSLDRGGREGVQQESKRKWEKGKDEPVGLLPDKVHLGPLGSGQGSLPPLKLLAVLADDGGPARLCPLNDLDVLDEGAEDLEADLDADATDEVPQADRGIPAGVPPPERDEDARKDGRRGGGVLRGGRCGVRGDGDDGAGEEAVLVSTGEEGEVRVGFGVLSGEVRVEGAEEGVGARGGRSGC